jgi:hypothetical protein
MPRAAVVDPDLVYMYISAFYVCMNLHQYRSEIQNTDLAFIDLDFRLSFYHHRPCENKLCKWVNAASVIVG